MKEKSREDKGATLILTALVMVFLLGMVSFGTDLGWFYLNSLRIQRTADASSLAGVIHMPGFFSVASTVANDIATANGYTDGLGGTTVVPEPVIGEPHQLKVTVRDEVPTFFLRVFGFDTIGITREATAEYVLPLPLGSPDNHFGAGPGAGPDEFWAAIQGPFTKKEHGDPFATRCVLSFNDNNCGSGGSSNPQYRPEGYYYGVEVPLSSGITSFEVQTYDGGFYDGSSGPGDFQWGGFGGQCPGCSPATAGATTVFTMHDTDPTPLDHRDNPTVCSTTTNPEDSSPNTLNRWYSLCSFSVTSLADVGVYPLQIQTIGSGHAINAYGVRACAPSCAAPSGTQPRVYGITDISIWVDDAGATPEFFFAEVDDAHAGKDLVLELFDPGDAQPGVANSMSVIGPDDSVWPRCTYSAQSWKDGSTEASGSPSPCTIVTTRTTTDCGEILSVPGCRYNGDWLSITISLPGDYSCDLNAPIGPNDCWWKIRYNYGGTVNDRTTWAAKIIGNPVHLSFGGP